jgi:NADH-quinone oxidoreductase subunit A
MQFILLQITDSNNAYNYLPIVLQLIFAVGLIAGIMVLSNYLGPKRVTTDKLQNFESGVEIKGNWVGKALAQCACLLVFLSLV